MHVQEDGLYLKARIMGSSVNCLIDTGATRSILHPQKYYSISADKRPLIEPLGKTILLANGEKINPLGQVKLSLETQVGTFYQDFVVVETKEPLILGNDFFSSYQCVIDVANRSISIMGQSVECVLESRLESLFRLKLSENVKIPGNSEMVIPGYLSTSGGKCLPDYLLVESSKECVGRGLVLAKALVNPSQGMIPLRVMNPSHTSCELSKGTTLGNCSLVDEVLSDTAEVKLSSASLESENLELPEYLQVIFDESRAHLTIDQGNAVKSLLWSYRDLFAKSKLDRGKTHLVKHTINTGDHQPIKQRPRRLPLAKRQVERDEVERC